MLRKFKKFTKTPGVFFRDFFIKKYPVINCEQYYAENEEAALQVVDTKLWEIEKN